MYSCASENTEIAKYLLEIGFNVNAAAKVLLDDLKGIEWIDILIKSLHLWKSGSS